MERLFKQILLTFALFFAAYSADTHLGGGVYLFDKTVDPTSSVVRVSISEDDVQRLVNPKYNEDSAAKIFEEELWNIVKNKIYSKFNDDFDFIFCVLNSTSTGQLGFQGIMMPLRIDYSNVDLSYPNGGNIESYDQWGSDDKLKGVFYLPKYDAIKNGPSLHEFAHQWGAYILNEVFAHWGASGAGGQLGGFKYVRTLGHNQYQGSIDENWNSGFAEKGYSKNVIPYSDIELYLMGFKSAQDLRNANFKLDVYLNNGKTPSDISNDGKFTANKINSYTIDDLMKNFGGKERNPDFSKSQKNFKVLTVLMSLTDTIGQTIFSERAARSVEDINWFAAKTEYKGGYYNFYQATNKIGSIDVTGIKNSVKADIDTSNPDPNPAPQPAPKPKPANLTVLPVSLNLVEGYEDTSFVVSISNTGGEKVQLKDINVSGDKFVRKSTGGTWIQPLSALDSWVFAPVVGLAKGNYSATVTASFEEHPDMTAEIDLVVRAKTDPVPSSANLEIEPVILNYPENYGDSTVVITLINDGEINAFIDENSVISTGGDEKFIVRFSSGSKVISPNYENKTWVLYVKSGLAKGAHRGEITLTYDDGKVASCEILLNVVNDLTPLKEAKTQNEKYGVFFDKNPVSHIAQINLKSQEKTKSVKISVFDNLGNIVFVEQSRQAQKKHFVWNLNNLSGKKVANGAYLVVAECAGIDGRVYSYSAKIGVKR
ncbi:MAG: hypothetical protein LBH98_00130 [Chitinispirillales bacterium]|jgi:hypothetical protein|nr:hypothetical protein [Chitinispirillales bacterium]